MSCIICSYFEVGSFALTLRSAITLPQFFKNQGYVAAGTGKVFHEYGDRGPGYWGPNRTDDYSWSPEAMPYPDPMVRALE